MALGYARLRRILVIGVDGEALRIRNSPKPKAGGGFLSSILRASGGQVDRCNFETLRAVNAQLQDGAQALRTARCQTGRVVDGVPCGDVKAQLVHVLLAAMPPGPEKLLAIPTGLMTDRSGVDLLVEAGRAVIIGRRSGAQALTRPCGQQVSANDQ